MAIVTDRVLVEKVLQEAKDKGTSVALFCTASPWNNEAILKACQNFGRKHNIEHVPVIVGMTGSYRHMQQCKRVTMSHDLKTGFLTLLSNLHELAGRKDSPYYDVLVMPQLDHGDPEADEWIFKVGIEKLAGVMFDCQRFPYEKNVEMTKAYIKEYGKQVMVESAMEELAVLGHSVNENKDADYVDRAVRYMKETGTDFLVADLGTEQQSTSTHAVYLKDRARMLTAALGEKKLVLHGVSSLPAEQITGLAEDGIVKVNMWTRIAREAGQYAAAKIREREAEMEQGIFDACDPQTYINDAAAKAIEIMEEHLAYFNYGKLAD